MRTITAVAWLNLRQGIRERLFFGVVVFLAFFLALCVLLGKLSPGESEKVIRAAGLGGIEASALILTVFSLVLGFYREKDTRILEVYLSHFSRGQYLGGKLIGYLLILAFYLFLSACGYGIVLASQKMFVWPVLAGIGMMFLKLSILISLCLGLCCLFSRSPLLALLGSLCLYLAAETASSAFKIIALGADKTRLILFKCLYYLLPNVDKLDIKAMVIYGELPKAGFFIRTGLYSAGYILFIWLITRCVFLRKEY